MGGGEDSCSIFEIGALPTFYVSFVMVAQNKHKKHHEKNKDKSMEVFNSSNFISFEQYITSRFHIAIDVKTIIIGYIFIQTKLGIGEERKFCFES